MANIFDQFDAPADPALASAPAPVPATAPAPAAPVNPFDRFDAGPGVRAPVDPNAPDWSRMNQPFGELKPADVSPTQQTKWAAQNALISGGMSPYVAGKLGGAAIDIGRFNPVLGPALSGADVAYDIGRRKYGAAALDALGVVPAVTAGRRAVQAVRGTLPTMPMADVPGVNAAGIDELRQAGNAAYNAVRNNPMTFHPQMMDDTLAESRIALTRRGLNPVKAPSTFSALDAAGAPRPPGAFITPDDLDTLRQQLRGGVPGTQDALAGRLATEILDRRMANPMPYHVRSGTGADLADLRNDLATGRGNWRALRTAETVEGRIDTSALKAAIAHSGANLDNTTRQHLASLLTTQAGRRAMFGARPDELAAVRDAASGDWLTNTLRYGGKLLGGGGGLGQFIASSTGGGAGTTLSHMLGADPLTAGGIGAMSSGATMAGGVGLRMAADARTTQAARNVADMIRRNSPEYAARAAQAPPIPDPRALARDAITYALMPQLSQQGRSAWNAAHVPYPAQSEEQP